MKKRSHLGIILFTIFTVILSVFETLAYKKTGVFSITASRIWIIWTVYFTVCSLLMIIKTLWQDVKGKNLWGIFALLVVTILVSIKLYSFPLNISGETTQQLASALQNTKIQDLNYTKYSFLGYPSRQYLLAIWPTVFFGISITSYRVGYLFPFLFGIFLFYAGIRKYYTNYSSITSIAGLGILAVISFPVMPILLRTFEQITFPISFSLQAIGWLLIVLRKFNFHNILAFLWTLTTLSTTYTPALASWTLLIVMLAIIALKGLSKRNWLSLYIIILCIVTAFLFFTSSLQGRTDIKLMQNGKTIKQTAEKIPEVFSYFLDKNVNMYDNQVLFLGKLMFLPIIIYLLGSLFGIWGIKHFALTLWIVATIITSGLVEGYANPPIHFGIHRSVVVLPFLLLGLIDIISYKNLKLPSKIILLFFIIFILYDIFNVYSIYDKANANSDVRSIVLRETLKTTKEFSIPQETPIQLGIFTQYPQPQYFPDHLKYFYPNAKLIPTNDCPKELINVPTVIYLSKNHECYQTIMKMVGSRQYTISSIQYQPEEIKKSIKSEDLSSIQKIIISQ